jgi:hypothetical protein
LHLTRLCAQVCDFLNSFSRSLSGYYGPAGVRILLSTQEGAAAVLSLRLSPALAAALAAEAHRRSTAAGGVPVSPASVARVLLERALLVGPTSSTPDPDTVEMVLQTVLSRFQDQGRIVPPAVEAEARKTIRNRLSDAAQRPHQSSTPRSTPQRAEATAAPPAASVAVAAGNDDQEAADARHDARNAEHTAAEDLRAEMSALKMSSRGLAEAMTAAGFKVSGHAVAEFIGGRTAGLPRWTDKFRAWRAANPPAAPSPDLQRPLFSTGSPSDTA